MERISIAALVEAIEEVATVKARTTHTVEEDGRTYLRDWLDVYPFPLDNVELRRADTIHFICDAIVGGPFQAMLPVRPNRGYTILDVGSGAGHWCFELAAQRPDCKVRAVDIHGGQPFEFPNLTWERGFDFERDWGIEANSYDLVRCAMLAGCVSDWPLLIRRAGEVLKHGAQVELVEIDWRPRSDEPKLCHSWYVYWYEKVARAARDFGKPIDSVAETIENSLEASGFRITGHRRERLCGEHSGLHKNCMNVGCVDDSSTVVMRRTFELLTDPALGHLECLSMRLLTQRGWTAAEVRTLCKLVRKELQDDDELQPWHEM